MQKLHRKKYGTLVGGTTNRYKSLSGVALNATAADRTITLDVHDMTRVRIDAVLTRSAATTLVMTPTTSQDGGTTYCTPQSDAVSGGAATMSDFTKSKSVSGNVAISTVFDVDGADYLKIVFSGANAGADDKIDVYATGVVGE